MKKKDRVEQALRRARLAVEDAGWTISTRVSPTRGVVRLVARKRVIEDDHSETFKFESAYGVEALAAVVQRRERESVAANRSRKEQA